MDVLLRFWLKARKYLSQIVLIASICLAASVGYLYMQEQNITYPAKATPAQWTPKDIIEPDSPISDFLTTFTTEMVPIQDSDVAIIMTQSIWERREGASAEDLQRDALALYQQAQQAYQAGDLQRAQNLARQAQRKVPNYTENNRLLEQIQAALP